MKTKTNKKKVFPSLVELKDDVDDDYSFYGYSQCRFIFLCITQTHNFYYIFLQKSGKRGRNP